MTEAALDAPRFPRLRALLYVVAALAFGAVLIVGMTWFVLGAAPRSQSIAVSADVAVAEFATLPDDDAYPAALALGIDGTLYTGSYQTGALWAISRAGAVAELPGSRARIGSVTGLDAAADGALYILDRIAPLDAKGAVIWRYADGKLGAVLEIPHDETDGLVLPEDIAADSAGMLYISDRKTGKVWRYTVAGEALGVFWQMPCAESCAATGLAYDSTREALLITDSERDAVYRVAASENPGRAEIIYVDGADSGYGIDGITVTPGGEIYVTLLAWNRAARLQDGGLIELAKDFRGASDLAYDADADRLYVTNWNQFSLGFGTRPQLPFALDVIELSP